MKSLVTGGAGFIGSHIVDRLIDLGHDVVVLDTETSQVHDHFYYNSKAVYYKLDIAEYESTKKLYEGVDYVFHCAAESRIQPTILNPLGAVKTNVLGTATVLQCAREAGVKKVMYSSTSSGYGLRNTPPLVETMPDDCLNPYSVSKVSGEKLCSMYTKLFGLKTIIFRYFNVYGEREPLRGPYAPVVGLFLRQFAAGESLTIVPDGTQRRDFTHVDDVVNANVLAMQVDEHSHYGEVFNVGTGTNHSVLELADMISPDTIMVAPRLGEAYITLANNEKIKRVFGWKTEKRIEDYISEKVTELRLLDPQFVI
jgi:UDP-glucose 4-epimerase